VEESIRKNSFKANPASSLAALCFAFGEISQYMGARLWPTIALAAGALGAAVRKFEKGNSAQFYVACN
jgi:hypothetical protein